MIRYSDGFGGRCFEAIAEACTDWFFTNAVCAASGMASFAEAMRSLWWHRWACVSSDMQTYATVVREAQA